MVYNLNVHCEWLMLQFTLCYQMQRFLLFFLFFVFLGRHWMPFPLNFWPSGHLTSVLYFKGDKWTFLKVRLIKVPLDSREHKETNIKTKHICMNVGKLYLTKTDFVRLQGTPLMDGHLLRGKIQAWGSIEILVIHASAYCSVRKKIASVPVSMWSFYSTSQSFILYWWKLLSVVLYFFLKFLQKWKPSFVMIQETVHIVIIFLFFFISHCEAVSPETNAALVFGVDEGRSWSIKDSPGRQTETTGDRTPHRGSKFNSSLNNNSMKLV